MELETIGEDIDKVWRTLNEMRGKMPAQEFSRKINLNARDVALTAGWLARENNILIQRHNYLLYVSHDTFWFYFKRIDRQSLRNIIGIARHRAIPIIFLAIWDKHAYHSLS